MELVGAWFAPSAPQAAKGHSSSSRSRMSGVGLLLATVLLVLGCCSHGVTAEESQQQQQQQQQPPSSSHIINNRELQDTSATTKSISGFVYITLKHVSNNPMPDNVIAAYEMVCGDFFGQALGQFNPPIRQVSAEMVQQSLLPAESSPNVDEKNGDIRRRSLRTTVADAAAEDGWKAHHKDGSTTTTTTTSTTKIDAGSHGRSLQQQEEPPQEEDNSSLPRLLTLVRVEGQIASDILAASLNDLLFFSIAADEAGFINSLKALPSELGFYFLSVTALEAFDPNDGFYPYPTAAPVTPETAGGGDGAGEYEYEPPDNGGDDGDGDRGIDDLDNGGDGDGDDDDDINTTALIFGVVGGALVLGAVLSLIWYLSKSSGSAAAEGADARDVVAETPTAGAAASSAAANTTPMVAATTGVAAVAPAATTPQPVSKPIRSDEVSPNADILPVGLIPPATSEQDAASMPTTVGGASSLVEGSESGNVSYTYSLDAGSMDIQSGGPGAISTLGGDQSTDFSGRPNMVVSREVIAPPGKLGIVIDTTLEGPIVQKVMPGSALQGVVSPGDIIVAIDGVDTRAMSGNAITALMFKTANKERRMTVLSEDEPDVSAG